MFGLGEALGVWGRMGKRFALYILAAFALVILVRAAYVQLAAASSGWWNENWLWRSPITITVQENVPAGYQENFLLAYNSGMAFDNFQDSRFVWENSTGKYVLPYWFENVNPHASAKVWVKLPVVLEEGQTYDNLKWYYGNPAAAPADNGENVFLLFDNFDTFDTTNKWVEMDLGDTYVKYDATNKWLYGNGNGGSYGYGIYSLENFTRPFVFELDTYFTAADYSFFGIKDDTVGTSSNYYTTYEHSAGTLGNAWDFHWWAPEVFGIGGFKYYTNVWARWGFIALPTQGGCFDNDLTNGWGDNYTNTNGTKTSLKVGLTTDWAYWRIDNVRVRKYADRVPTATAGAGQPAPHWQEVESWTGTESTTTPAWQNIESWSVTVNAVAGWQAVESWSGTACALGFVVNASPSSSSVQQGNSTTVAVDISAVNGYSQTVTLSASGTPLGVSVGFNPGGSVPSFSSSMTISVGGDASPSTYVIVITGTGGDGLVRTANYSLTVTQPQQQQQNPPPSSSPAPPPDVTPPTIDVLEPTSKNVGENVTVRFKVADPSGIDSGSISVTLDETPVQYTRAGDIITGSFIGLEAGEHVVKITAKDVSSNHNKASATVSFTVEQKTMVAAVALAVGTGENRTATFDNDNLPLKRVTISSNENIGENRALGSMVVSARLVESPPAFSPENVKVYACLEISVTTPESALASAIINFVVPETWLMANSLSSSEVALYHMESGVWVELQTTKVGEDNAFVYYSALAHSFSPFVIGVKTFPPAFGLLLPSAPLTVEGGYVQVTVWVSNPTSSQIQKRLELRLGINSREFDVAALPRGVSQIAVSVPAGWVLHGACDVWLYDPSENTLLDSGSITLSSTVGQPDSTVPIVSPQLQTYIILAGGASGVIAALGALRFVGKLPTPRMSRPRLRGRFAGEHRQAPVKTESPVLQGYEELLAPAARELSEESPIVQDYCNLLLPAALEASARKKVEHLGRAVKPHRRTSRS